MFCAHSVRWDTNIFNIYNELCAITSKMIKQICGAKWVRIAYEQQMMAVRIIVQQQQQWTFGSTCTIKLFKSLFLIAFCILHLY